MPNSVNINDPIQQLPFWVVPIDLREIVNCDDPDGAERRQEFINRVYGLQAEVKKETERLTANNVAALDAKHEAQVIKCKQALADFNEVMLQRSFYEGRERELSRQVNEASFAVKIKKDSPLQPAYATKSDLAQWDSELAELQSTLDSKMSGYHSHQNVMSLWLASCNRLKAVHDAATVEESELRLKIHRLTSKSTGPQPTSIGLSA